MYINIQYYDMLLWVIRLHSSQKKRPASALSPVQVMAPGTNATAQAFSLKLHRGTGKR